MTWEQLSEIYRLNAEEAEREANTLPVDCPNDGTVLDAGNGWLHCPMGDYTVQV